MSAPFSVDHAVEVVRTASKVVTRGLVITLPSRFAYVKGAPLLMFLLRTDRLNTYWMIDFTYPDVSVFIEVLRAKTTMVREDTVYVLTDRQLNDAVDYYARKHGVSKNIALNRYIPPVLMANSFSGIIDIALVLSNIIFSPGVRILLGKLYEPYTEQEMAKLAGMVEMYNRLRDLVVSEYGYEQFGEAGIYYARIRDLNSACIIDYSGRIKTIPSAREEWIYRVLSRIAGYHMICYRTYV